MRMIDILKKELKEGMTIENDRELSDKYKLTIVYDGMKAPVVLVKACAPGCEKKICRKAIDTALSTMYINAGNLSEAKRWLDGEFWKESIDMSEFTREEKPFLLLMKDKEWNVSYWWFETEEEMQRVGMTYRHKGYEVIDAIEIQSCRDVEIRF